jgi:Holliday junction resolvasome RuvABC ATP-dependent DNA helicase subunit
MNIENENKPKKLAKKVANDLMDKIFATIVGMDSAKAKIRQLVNSALVDDYLPPIAIIATAGLGKTKLLKVVLHLFQVVLGRKVVWFPRGEDLGTRLKFVEEQYIPKVHDHDAGIGIDEVHEIKGNVQSLLRSLIEITAERLPKTIRAVGDSEATFDPKRNFIVIATNKVEKLDKPFLSRFEIIRLPKYTLPEMKSIVRQCAKKLEVKMDESAVTVIAEANRGTARDVIQWGDCAKAFMNDTGKKVLDKKGALEVVKLRETFPQGINRDELNTLLLLEEAKRNDSGGEMQLKELAGRNNVTSSEQNSNETYLRTTGMIRTRGTRSLTIKGAEYLSELRKLKFIPELKNKNALKGVK